MPFGQPVSWSTGTTARFRVAVATQTAPISLEVVSPTVETTDEDWQTKIATIKERNELMFNNSLLSDIKFAFTDQSGKVKTIPAHKYVLAISSPVFFSMFYSQIAERSDTIEITDCDSESFLELLRYIYSDKANLSNCDHALRVWYSAQKYFIPSLVKKCVAYLDKNVGVNDVLDVLSYAMKFEEESLQSTCWKIIDFHAQMIVKSDSQHLDHDLLVSMFKRDSLRLDGEIELFRSLDRWAQRKCEEGNIEATGENKREVIGENLFRLVRFPVLKQEDFAREVLPTNLLTKNEIIDIFKQFSSVDVETLKFSTEPRQTYSKEIRQSRFTSASHGWSCKNTETPDAIIMSVNKPIKLCGFSLFGSHEAEYTVDLKLFRNELPSTVIARCTDKFVTNRSYSFKDQTKARGFDCLFRTPVYMMENTKYTVQAFINGPDSCYGLECGAATSFDDCLTLPHRAGISFTFYDVNDNAKTTCMKGQIHAVIFMAV